MKINYICFDNFVIIQCYSQEQEHNLMWNLFPNKLRGFELDPAALVNKLEELLAFQGSVLHWLALLYNFEIITSVHIEERINGVVGLF